MVSIFGLYKTTVYNTFGAVFLMAIFANTPFDRAKNLVSKHKKTTQIIENDIFIKLRSSLHHSLDAEEQTSIPLSKLSRA